MPDRADAPEPAWGLASTGPAAFGPQRLFLLLAPLLYLAYALLTPPFQTPDEHQHLFRAYQLASFQFIGERRGNESGGLLPPALVRAAVPELGTAAPHAPRPRPRTTLAARFARATALNPGEAPRFTNFLGSVAYSPAGYLPQVMAIWIGRALGLTVEMIVRLGRIFNAAFTVALLYAAFRALPVGRLLLLFVALLPMTAACAGSFGQDGLIVAGSAWLTALGVRAVVRRRWTRRDAIAAAVLASAVTLAKMVYLPLAGLALLPRPTGATLWRWVPPPLAAVLLAAVLLAAWMRLTAGLLVPMGPGMPAPADQVAHLLRHPLAFPQAFFNTWRSNGIGLLGQLFTFGWLNVGPVKPAFIAAAAALALALWHGDARAGLLSAVWRGWALAISATIVLLLALALYVAASPFAATSIQGLQGRYFLPLALPFLLTLLRSRPGGQPWIAIGIAALLLVANLAALAAIGNAYYA